MSRLSSFIRRLEAQRACLDFAARRIAGRKGIVLELGLGNGRSYDHLRELLPDREIYVFDRQIAAHPDCIPPDDRLFLGDFAATLPAAFRRFGAGAAILIHADLGSGDAKASADLARALLPQILVLLASGGYLLGDQAMLAPGLKPLSLPPGIKPDRYFLAEKL